MSAARQTSLIHGETATNPAHTRPDNRLPVRIPGRFMTESSEEHRMVCVTISGTSAEVRAHVLPPSGSAIVCYFDDIGRVVGVVDKSLPKGFIVGFTTTEFKRDKIADRVIWLANKDVLGLSDERSDQRFSAGGAASVRLASGETLACRVVDISLSGAGFEATGAAPAIGEIVEAGSLRGEVVRSAGRSFGIRFLHAR